MRLFFNGEYVNDFEIKISPFDHGFLYGLGLFETFRVYDGHPFLLHDHLNRLRSSLSSLNIEWNYSNEEIRNILHKLIDLNGLRDAYIRLNVSAGDGEIGLYTGVYSKPNTIIFIKPMPNTNITEKEGVLLSTPRNTPEGNERLKSHHYLNSLIGKREIGDLPTKEGIFFTKEGYLAEGVVSNLFFVKNKILHTPHSNTGILNGITRQFVLHWSHLNGVQVEEGYYTKNELLSSDEVFMTNSIQEIVPITKIGTHDFEISEFVTKLQDEYKQNSRYLWSMNELKGSDCS